MSYMQQLHKYILSFGGTITLGVNTIEVKYIRYKSVYNIVTKIYQDIEVTSEKLFGVLKTLEVLGNIQYMSVENNLDE